MTDLGLTKLCAEAMGYLPSLIRRRGDSTRKALSGKPVVYWPLTDDAQAMALIQRFPVTCVDAMGDLAPLDEFGDAIPWGYQSDESNRAVNINRVVCEAVAKMMMERGT